MYEIIMIIMIAMATITLILGDTLKNKRLILAGRVMVIVLYIISTIMVLIGLFL